MEKFYFSLISYIFSFLGLRGFLLAVFYFGLHSAALFAQLTGVKTIAATGGNYTSLQAAIADLNNVGVGVGGVTFNVPAGWTETFTSTTAGRITPSGTLANPIVFQKSGSGANPLITAYAIGTGTIDYVFGVEGARNYITFDGIDVQANSSSANATQMVEFGYFINGAMYQGNTNNTIKNCTITLNNANTNLNCGVYQVSNAVHVNGRNDNNVYDNITVNNAGGGIYIKGISGYPDEGCVVRNCKIGLAGPDNITFPSTVPNKAPFGIRVEQVNGITISNNTIANVTFSNAASVVAYQIFYPTGIYLTDLTGTVNVISNTIRDIKRVYTGSSASPYPRSGGIVNVSTLIAAQTLYVYNNFVSGIYCTQPNISTPQSVGNMQTYGIYSGGAAITAYLYHNTIYLRDFPDCRYYVSTACVYFVTAVFTARNNIFKNEYTYGISGTGKSYCMYIPSGTFASDYNMFYINNASPTAPYFVGADNVGDKATLSDWRGGIRDLNSNYNNAVFKNATLGAEDLHLDFSSIPFYDNSKYYGTNTTMATVTDDIDGEARIRPLKGADEVDFCTPLPTISSTNSPICTGNNAVFTITGFPNSQVTYKMNGGSNQTAILNTSGEATVTVVGASANQSLALVNVSSCTQSLTETALVNVYPLPTAYTLSEGGDYCLNTSGVELTLSDSDEGTSYQLRLEDENIGLPVLGTGNSISFGPQTDEGIYTVLGGIFNCFRQMNGTAYVATVPFPVTSPIYHD